MNLRKELYQLIEKCKQQEGTTDSGAVRDIMTDLMHICIRNQPVLEFPEIVESASEVFAQEIDEEVANVREVVKTAKEVVDKTLKAKK